MRSSQHTFCYFWGPASVITLWLIPLVCWNLFHASVKGLVRQTVPHPPLFDPNSPLHTGCISTVMGVPLKTPSGLENPLFLSPCSLANLILLLFLPDVSWLRGIDKRLCVIPWLWKSQHLLSGPLSSVRHFHVLSLIPGTDAEQRDMFLISKWLAPGKLFLYRVLQFVFAHGSLTWCVCVWIDAKHRRDYASRQW